MGKLVFGMMQSLDGYIAGATGGPQLPPPGDQLHRHFNDYVRGLGGVLCGRRMYEVMRYWDDDRPDWDAVEREFAAAWRAKPKWVVSRTLEIGRAECHTRPRRRRSVCARAQGEARR